MTVSTPGVEDESRRITHPAEPQSGRPLVGVGHRCANCGADLAADQRYCVECGTRRGTPRFVLAGATAQESVPTAPVPRPVAVVAWSRLSVILGVIAILLALGVGLLIGNATRATIKQPVKVELTGGTPSSATPSGGSSGTAPTSKGNSGGASPNSCTSGTAGCKNGKQTGNFFGG